MSIINRGTIIINLMLTFPLSIISLTTTALSLLNCKFSLLAKFAALVIADLGSTIENDTLFNA